MTITKVHGPPGTGKTTALLSIMKRRGDEPDRLGFVAFTRAAIEEARGRLDVTEKEAPYIRTMHSLCFRGLGYTKTQIMKKEDYKEFGGRKYRFADRYVNPDDADLDEMAGMIDPNKAGEAYLHFNQWARQRRLPYPDALKLFPYPGDKLAFEWTTSAVLGFCHAYDDWRAEHGKVDFTDLLEKALQQQYMLPVETLYVDEAQDLSPLQWTVIRQWARVADNVILAGDADQAIYEFQGAQPDLFLGYPADEEIVLDRSYRLPSALLERAQRLIQRNKRRKAFTLHARAIGGVVKHFGDVTDFPAQRLAEGGSTFILARNIYLLDHVREHLIELGVPFMAKRGPKAWGKTEARAVLALWRLHHQEMIDRFLLHALIEKTPTKPYWRWGAKTELKKINSDQGIRCDELPELGATEHLLTAIQAGQPHIFRFDRNKAAYLWRILRTRGEDGLTKRPKVAIGTIHSVKGQEADNVILLSGMTRRTYESYWNDPEPERRVFYVGMTRARENLWLQTAYYDRHAFPEL